MLPLETTILNLRYNTEIYERNPPSSSNPPIDKADFLDFPAVVEDFLRLRPAPSDELIPDVCVSFDDDLDFFRFLSSLVV